jgi:hypothetical protein
MTRFVLALGALLALTAAGCGDDEVDGFAVRGYVEASSDDLGVDSTGFRFPTMTNLVPVDEVLDDQTFGGRCVITAGPSGDEATAVSVDVLRTMASAGPGLRQFQVQIDDLVDADAVVTVVIGTRQFFSSTGGTSCTVVGSTADVKRRTAQINPMCLVQNADGQTAMVDAELFFQECDVL